MGVAGGAAANVQIDILKKILLELVQRQNPKTVPCSECGKNIPIKEAIIMHGEKKVLCKECYNKIHSSKGPS